MLISPAISWKSFQRVHFLRMLSKSLINMTDFYATLDIAAKFFKKRTHFNNSRFLIMCYKNTENAPNVDYNGIPRQNTQSHIISKLQSRNYYYDSMNINVTMKTTISNHRNETAMVFIRICDAVITSYPINIFSMGTLFTKVVKIIDQHDWLLRYPSHCNKVFQESNAHQQQQISHQPNATAMFFKRISDADITSYLIKIFSTGTLFRKVIKIIDQYDRLLRNPRHCSKVFQESNALQQQQISHNVLQKHWKWKFKLCIFLIVDESLCNASSGSQMWRWFLLNTRVSVTSDTTLLTYGLLQFYCVESIDDTL